MRRHLHIERLVIDGLVLDARGCLDFQQVLQARLVQLLAAPSAAGELVPEVLQLPAQVDPAALGQHAAASIAAALPAHAYGAAPPGVTM